jgi:hypothetical protein
MPKFAKTNTIGGSKMGSSKKMNHPESFDPENHSQSVLKLKSSLKMIKKAKTI